jgi:hypothetical protein
MNETEGKKPPYIKFCSANVNTHFITLFAALCLRQICEAPQQDFSAVRCSLVSLFTKLQGVEQTSFCDKHCSQK